MKGKKLMAKKVARVTEDQFTDSHFQSAKEKALEVNAVIRALEGGLDSKAFAKNKRAYHFFTQTLSMPAEYDINGFAYYHLISKSRREELLAETRRLVRIYAGLDEDRGSDVAAVFTREPYAALIGA